MLLFFVLFGAFLTAYACRKYYEPTLVQTRGVRHVRADGAPVPQDITDRFKLTGSLTGANDNITNAEGSLNDLFLGHDTPTKKVDGQVANQRQNGHVVWELAKKRMLGTQEYDLPEKSVSTE